ncbi:endonuclease MutS2 [Peptococcaceae bacterium]|nr:endonuclease MutS2 [Peptococcaceae bacterium]
MEFDKVLKKLASYTSFEVSKEIAMNLKPLDSVSAIKQLQEEVTQACSLIRKNLIVETDGLYDIRKHIADLEREIVLGAVELMHIAKMLYAARRFKQFFNEHRDECPLLFELARDICILPEIEREITRCILPDGEIADAASSELLRIRRQISNKRNKIKETIDAIIKDKRYQKCLQEPIVTIRNDRYVIPVKQEYKGAVRGIVHDRSASGATLFVEPESVVEINNELKKLLLEEKDEMNRILKSLSKLVRAACKELKNNVKILAYLDFVFAKAYYSIELDAASPAIVDENVVNLKKARHPLLPPDKVVPLDVNIGEDFKTLVITGPNTGGKTVSLKTTGLIVLMARAGLHIPADSESKVGMCDVMVDIGDEQSIEQSLSTFSSHMSNIVHILKVADENSLVLLDELGAGTDPTEGAALAQAILQHLYKIGACTIITTHYGELKNFAYEHEGAKNACVDFDTQTLKPTYELIIGRAGSSNAFDIAEKLGLPKEIIRDAKEFLTQEQKDIKDLLRKIEEDRRMAEMERNQAEKARIENEALKKKLKELESQLMLKKQQIIDRAKEEALAIIREAKRTSEQIIKELKENISKQSTREQERAIRAARESLKRLLSSVSVKSTTLKPTQNIKKGDLVYLPEYNSKGYVLELTGDKAVVQSGILKVTVSKEQLQLYEQTEETKEKSAISKFMKEKTQAVKSQLDLRGMKAEEAIAELEKYLDDVILSNLNQITIIHGKGTGALKKAVHAQLKNRKEIKSFRLGKAEEGGDGVTIVELI